MKKKEKDKDEGFQRLRTNLEKEGLAPKENPGGKEFKKVFPEDAKIEPVKPEKPAKAKKDPKPKQQFINKYGFLHLDKNIAEHLGVTFGKEHGEKVPVTIELIDNGFIVKKV